VICLHLISGFDYIWCMAMPICLWCRIVVGFSWFSSCLLLILSFYVLRVLAIGWGKRKANGARGVLNETQKVM